MRYLGFLLFVCAPFLSAQTISVGAKGGGLFTDPAERIDQSRPYVVGPSLEIGLGSRFAVEANALYSRFGTGSVAGVSRGHSVEFPLLGKFYFADREDPVRAYVASGFSFRNIWLDRLRLRSNTTDPAVGAVVGGGVTFRAGFLKFSPEVRYTRWGGYNFPATNPNQVQALLGVTF